MKVLLVAVNARWTHSSLALRYLRNAVEAGFGRLASNGGAASSHTVVLREYEINQPRIEMVRDIASIRPDVVAFSVYIWNARLVAAIIPDVRGLCPDAALIAGGPEVSYAAEDWLLRCPELDLVVVGPGEGAMEDLAAGGFDLSAIPGKILRGRPVDFPALGFPYRDGDWPLLAKRYLYYESSRGCPFSCSYCLSSRSDQALVYKSVPTVLAELGAIVERGPSLVKFVDRSFNADPARARELWRAIILRWADAGCRFHFEVYPALLADEDFAALANAPEGLFQFEIGVQTVDPATRAAVSRGGDWSRERGAIARLVALHTVHLHLDLIAGLPGEGMAELGRSFDETLALGADHVQLGFLKGLPGTALRDAPHGAIFQSDPPYEVLRTGALSSDDLSTLARVALLLDSLAERAELRPALAAVRDSAASAFSAFVALSDFCARIGFDVRTRDRAKLESMLARFFAPAVAAAAAEAEE